MTLADLDLEAIRQKILGAYHVDDPLLEKFRHYAQMLSANVRPLKRHSINSVAFVASDGGDNRLVFNPASIELVRVADSRGIECALDVIASTSGAAEIDKRGRAGDKEAVRPLVHLCSDLQTPVSGLSNIVMGMGQPGRSVGAMRAYRDIVEWAVLYDLICDPKLQWGSDTILVREGLLRSVFFKRSVFPLMDKRIREGIAAQKRRNIDVSIVGVAKKNAVLGRLAVALELEGTFHKNFPCFAEVPREVEADCYNYERDWLETLETLTESGVDGMTSVGDYRSMGRLFLVKFGDRPMDPVWPVDVASWQVEEAPRILGQLTGDAQLGFPIPDFPMCIQRAHEHAKLSGMEIKVLQDALVQGVASTLSPDEAERLFRFDYLGRSLAGLRYKES